MKVTLIHETRKGSNGEPLKMQVPKGSISHYTLYGWTLDAPEPVEVRKTEKKSAKQAAKNEEIDLSSLV